MASRQENMNIIFDVCGKENFDNLNQLFHIFKDKWLPAFKVIKLYEDLKNKVENDDTKQFNEIIDKRNKILNSMIEYRKEHIKQR